MSPKCDLDSRLSSHLSKRVTVTENVIKVSFTPCELTRITAEDQTIHYSHFFLGDGKTQWRTHVPTYRTIAIKNLVAGLDLRIRLIGRAEIEYEYTAAESEALTLFNPRYEGAQRIVSTRDGVTYAIINDSDFIAVMPNANCLKLESQSYSQHTSTECYRGRSSAPATSEPDSLPLTLSFSTFLGNLANDQGHAIAVDRQGNSYVAGLTKSIAFPVAIGYQMTHAGDNDLFLSKLSSNGTAILYSTYLGGNSDDRPFDIDVDPSGSTFITGWTKSYNFPLTSMLSSGHSSLDIFVTKLSPAGDSLLFSTLIGGSSWDEAYGIDVDTDGSVVIAGLSASPDFPTFSPLQDFQGEGDAVLFKLTPNGREFVFSTFLSGSIWAEAFDVALTTTGQILVTGRTSSPDFPVLNALLPTYQGGVSDAFVCRIAPDGTEILYSTFLGGSGEDVGNSIAADPFGNYYIAGRTGSSNFPSKNCAQDHLAGGYWDIFVTKFAGAVDTLVYSTYWGGALHYDEAQGIVADSFGRAYLTGYTASRDFPLTNPILDYRGSRDAIVVIYPPTGNQPLYSTCLGGQQGDEGWAIACDDNGGMFVTGRTGSSDFPLAFAIDNTFGGGSEETGYGDVFITKLRIPRVGDTDGNGIISISDAVALINYIFSGGPGPTPLGLGDADCNGLVTISDAVYLIQYIFAGGPAPCER